MSDWLAFCCQDCERVTYVNFAHLDLWKPECVCGSSRFSTGTPIDQHEFCDVLRQVIP